VFAAGNGDAQGHPIDISDPAQRTYNGFATHPNVIAVAASSSKDKVANYSNYGKEISISAPSSSAGCPGILTTDVRGAGGYNPVGDYCNDFGGTSSAAPLVSGIAALVLSVNPNLTSGRVKTILEETARKVGAATPGEYDARGHSVHFGYGVVNAEEAVRVALQIRQGDRL
jgi:hypothetical protein